VEVWIRSPVAIRILVRVSDSDISPTANVPYELHARLGLLELGLLGPTGYLL
jgi:hypothetical protein